MAATHLLLYVFMAVFAPHWGNEAADIRSCIDNFVVHTNKIIRTQDSRALGAKYLTEAEVASREDCLQLCCETLTCDVFVYEHKRRGSCYLFHCGDPQDFKCKFTQHRNYSSGLLMPTNELESQIKLSKHEQELAQLSGKKTESNVPVIAVSTSPPTTTTNKVPTPANKVNVNDTARSECSRYQFECRSTKECIAIYNACDGIPQCPDGSDEGPELDCPAIAGAPSGSSANSKTGSNSGMVNVASDVKKPFVPPQQLPYSSYVPGEKPDSNQESLDAHQQLINARLYGREGEGPADMQASSANGWHSYMGQQRRPQEDGSRIFSHKGGLETGDSAPPVPYGNEMGREYLKSSAGGGYYNGFPYNNGPAPYNWPQRRDSGPCAGGGYHNGFPYNNGPAPYNWPQRRDDPRWMYPGPQPDYFYEENQGRARFPGQQQPDHRVPQPEQAEKLQNSFQKPVEPPIPPAPKEVEKTTLTKVEEDKPRSKETNSVKKVIPELKTVVPTHPSQSMGLIVKEDDVVILEADGENERPRGAILSLALGMCIAAIMITLVGCRLRVVQRRLRRGKSGYAHDADFLVNGMYL